MAQTLAQYTGKQLSYDGRKRVKLVGSPQCRLMNTRKRPPPQRLRSSRPSIQTRAFPLKPDYVLDWREYFEGAPNRKGHRIRRQEDWDEKLIPALYQIESEVADRESRLIRARGFARLSAWFGFGYVFSSVAGYKIEVQQSEDRFWRSDDQPSFGFSTEVQKEIQLLDPTSDRARSRRVACGISVTGDLPEDVLKDLQQRERVQSVLFLQPAVGLG